MSVSFIMVLAMGVLFAAGIYLMLERSLTRVLLGFILLGNGVNLLIILTAGRGSPPLTDGRTCRPRACPIRCRMRSSSPRSSSPSP
jgi:multicomponent Na+:H+ antiporter subunit C